MKNNPSTRSRSQLATLASVSLWLTCPFSFAQVTADAPADQRNRVGVVEFSITKRAKLMEGSSPRGEIDTADLRFSATQTTVLANDGSAFFGGEWRQLMFAPSGATVPDRLVGAAVKLGYQRKLGPQWSIRAEIDPGLYSDFDRITGRDLNAPLDLRCVYARSPSVQWLAGLTYDSRSGRPLLGYGGVRWQAAPAWLLLVTVPVTRVEYAAGPGWTLFGDATLFTSSYRVADDFGRRRHRPELDGQDVDYRQITATAGVRWQMRPTTAISIGAGWAFDRRFEFHDRNLLLKTRGAPTIQIALHGAF